MKTRMFTGAIAVALAVTILNLTAETAVMPICCVADFEKLSLVPMSGVDADLSRIKPGEGGPALKINFTKTGEERRFIALQTVPKEPLAEFRALDLQYSLDLPEEMNLHFAVLVLEADGGAWCRTGRPLRSTDDVRSMRFPVQGLREAAFSQDASGELDWKNVERFWVGFTADGTGSGAFELRKLVLTSEPYRPSEPVELMLRDPKNWSISADSAVTHDTEAITLDGMRCIKTTFTFPGGRHMYLVPAQAADEMEYSAYAGLRITYKAQTPPGIDGLLVSVFENNGQFVAKPPPKATGEWRTVMIPWSGFELGSWTQDNNGKLDPDAISRISIGVHGVSTGEGGKGEVIVKSIEAVPPEAK